MDRNRHMATRTSHPVDNVHPATDTTSPSAAEQIGPRAEGVVYYDGPRMVQVKAVVTDPSEARRILRRNAAKFAVLVRDPHAGTEHYTGAVWTGSDRVVKAVA
jgi:hypothetical protein